MVEQRLSRKMVKASMSICTPVKPATLLRVISLERSITIQEEVSVEYVNSQMRVESNFPYLKSVNYGC